MMEQVPLVRRGSYPLRCIRSPGQSERLAPAFRTNRTSWCALFDVCSITCTHSGCFGHFLLNRLPLGLHFQGFFWHSVTQFSEPTNQLHSEQPGSVQQPSAHACSMNSTSMLLPSLEGCENRLAQILPLSLLSPSLSPSRSLPLPLSQFCNSTNYSLKPRAFLLSASLQNMIL